jgi:hypothetical protein
VTLPLEVHAVCQTFLDGAPTGPVTGSMTTKNGAGRWGLGYYPERFHRVLREALRVRIGGGNEYLDDDGTRGLDTAAFTAYVVEHGTARDG